MKKITETANIDALHDKYIQHQIDNFLMHMQVITGAQLSTVRNTATLQLDEFVFCDV